MQCIVLFHVVSARGPQTLERILGSARHLARRACGALLRVRDRLQVDDAHLLGLPDAVRARDGLRTTGFKYLGYITLPQVRSRRRVLDCVWAQALEDTASPLHSSLS